jgi:hypothetical protein
VGTSGERDWFGGSVTQTKVEGWSVVRRERRRVLREWMPGAGAAVELEPELEVDIVVGLREKRDGGVFECARVCLEVSKWQRSGAIYIMEVWLTWLVGNRLITDIEYDPKKDHMSEPGNSSCLAINLATALEKVPPSPMTPKPCLRKISLFLLIHTASI